MDDQEFRGLISPLVRSRWWVLVISGGLFLVGSVQLVGLVMITAMISTRNVAFFWKLLGLPAGILAVLAGWQMFRLYRLLSMSLRSVQLSIASEVAERARLALIFTGVMTLLFIFLTAGELFWSSAIYGWR